MEDFDDIQTLLKLDIAQLNRVITTNLSSNIALLKQISQYIIHSGGKRLRPLLLLLVARACGYKGSYHYQLAAVIEYIHTATLLHDDVVDESKIRRGQNSANENWGNSASVLTGDFLYSRAFEMMVAVNSMAVMAVLAKTTNTIAEGEVLQLLNCQNIDLDIKAYFDVIERKTACLFQAAAQLGAILANIKGKQQHILAQYGLHLGMAFQIVDDILDYQSDSVILGKKPGDDLAQGKVTLPMIYALSAADKDDVTLLISAIKKINTEQMQQIKTIFERTNAFKQSYKQAERHIKAAKKCLHLLENSPEKQALILLADLSLKRKF